MQITHRSIETTKGPSDWTTGDVYVAAPAGTSTFAAALVHFTPAPAPPGMRTAHGQTILMTEGVGRCQRAGGRVEIIRPGDRVFFERGKNHWHGAAPDHFMAHVAMQQNDASGSPVTWVEPVTCCEHVTDDEYGISSELRRLRTAMPSAGADRRHCRVCRAVGPHHARTACSHPCD